MRPFPFITETRVYLNLARLQKFFRKVKINPFFFLIPTVLGLAAAAFEGVSLSLLIPTVKGIIEGNITFVRDLPILKTILLLFPQPIESRSSTVFALLIVLIFLSAAAKNVFHYGSSLSISYQVNRFANQLRKLVYERYLSCGKLFFDQNNVGHLHQILTGYTGAIAEQLHVFNNVLYSCFILLVYLTIMFSISWPLTILVIILSPLLHCSVGWLIRKIKKTSESLTKSSVELAKKISNALSCIPLTKAYTSEEREKEWFGHASDQVEKFRFSIEKKQMLISPIQEIMVLSIVLFLVGVIAFFLFYEKSGTIAGYMVFFVILRRSMTTVGIFNSIQASLAAVKGPISEILKIFDDREKYFVPDGTLNFEGLKDRIEFHHLNFSYPKGVQVLKDLSLSIERGKMTALVGPSGAGKTTLINLILRFYDAPAGSIKIDGTDIREFTLESLRAKMALVSQETLLFNASFQMNLCYGLDGRAGSEDTEAAVKKARLYDLITKLPEGFETEIGDRGVKLSGGEKQRLSIARAILKGAEILILDEATSALDTGTEKLIQEAIDDVIKGRTAIVIAHRLSTIRHADKIIVIEDGGFVEQGALNELLERKSRFYRYWEAQKFY